MAGFVLQLAFAHVGLTMVLILFGILLAARCGARNVLLLVSAGLTSLAAIGYLTFWVYLANPHVGRAFAVVAVAVAVVGSAVLAVMLRKTVVALLKPFVAPTLLVMTASLFSLAMEFTRGDPRYPSIVGERRYVHALPVDNWLPALFARQLISTKRPLPHVLVPGWLSSDRPPLQTGIYLTERSLYGSDRFEMHYAATGIVLQTLWIFGVWALLQAFKVNRRASALVLTAVLFSGFAFVNTEFVWPKLIAAAFALVAIAIGLTGDLRTPRVRIAYGVFGGLDLAWGYLSHTGTAFAAVSLVVVLLVLRRRVSWRAVVACVVAALVLLVPWSAYQKWYDPPGNTLTWLQLAPAVPYDPNASITSMVVNSYKKVGVGTAAHYKGTNLVYPFRGELDTAKDVVKVVGSYIVPTDANKARRIPAATGYREEVYFHLWPTLGIAGLGPVFLLYAWWRRRSRDSPEFRLAALGWLSVAVNVVLWALILFGPDYTPIYQGTYAIELLGFMAGVLSIWVVSRRWATGLVLAQAAFTAWVYLRFTPLPEPAKPKVFHLPLNTAVLSIGLIAMAGCLVVLACMWGRTPRSVDPPDDAPGALEPATAGALD